MSKLTHDFQLATASPTLLHWARQTIEAQAKANKRIVVDGEFVPFDDLSVPYPEELKKIVLSTLDAYQRKYDKSDRQLRFVVFRSSIPNATAIWLGGDRSDWVVVSTGLLELLLAGAREVAVALQRQAKVSPEDPLRQMAYHFNKHPSLSLPGRAHDTTFTLLLLREALTFFIGHECGHHYDGHNGFYAAGAGTGAHVEGEIPGAVDSASLQKQALEASADYHGAKAALWRSFNDTRGFVEEKLPPKFHNASDVVRCRHYLSALGLFTSFWCLVPSGWNPNETHGLSHPPNVFRALEMLRLTVELFAEWVDDDKDENWMETGYLALMDAITVIKNVLELHREGKDRHVSARNPFEPLRSTGIRRGVFDETLGIYYHSLQQQYDAMRTLLNPYRRSSHLF